MKIKKFIVRLLVIFVVVIGAGIGYIYFSLGAVNTNDLIASDEELGISSNLDEDETNQVINIAMFGIDSRNEDSGRSDTIMILSLDFLHNKLKLSSIMRDTYVEIDDYGMTKLNHAYAYGGPKLSIKTINQTFDLNIRDYALVDFEGLKDIVDAVGGVDITIKDYEIPTMKTVGILTAGDYHLDGTQALTYCRIRHQGNGDYERTERQRLVLQTLFENLDLKNVIEMSNLMNEILPYVETSYSKTDILSIGSKFLFSGINEIEQNRFPLDDFSSGDKINGIYYLVMDKEENSKQLHNFIYNEE